MKPVLDQIREELESIRSEGLLKTERVIESPQSARIRVGGREVLNFCANNYLGLANDPRLREAARIALDKFGFGLSSVRFICGTQTLHKELEREISAFLDMDDAILYTSCFDANTGLFETILGEGDAVISDALNHASIIDGIRLCKAKRYRYAHGNMEELKKSLDAARTAGARRALVATDSVFSMDGSVAKLREICDLAGQAGALVMVDDSHATGFFGPTGRGAIEHAGVMGRIDIVTSTFGKALGGASGGFTVARQPIVDLLRQRSRPYLFSNTLPPALAAASLACVKLLPELDELRSRLNANTAMFRKGMADAGFLIKPGVHPIVPIMLGEATLAAQMAEKLFAEGVYVIGFSYPVVPRGEARIRVQISAAHLPEDIERAIAAFTKIGRSLGVCR